MLVARGEGPTLHVIYRSYGGENLKRRPPYYSKLLALASFVRAVQELPTAVDVIFLNDGPVPEDRVRLMRPLGEVVQIDGGSNLRSYKAAIRLATGRPWDDEDIVWFAEDDYLYRPDALSVLMAGVQALPRGRYFSLYSPADRDARRVPDSTPTFPRSFGMSDAVELDGTGWFRAMSTTSTFAVKLGVLREDRHLLNVCPYSGGAWDHTTCLAVQGRQPFPWRALSTELATRTEQPVSAWPRVLARVAVRAAINLRSRRRRARRRLLYAAEPLPIWHLETFDGEAPEDTADWARVAADTRSWAAQHLPGVDTRATVDVVAQDGRSRVA